MEITLNREIVDKLSPGGILAYVAIAIVGVKSSPEKMAAAIRVRPDLIKDGLASIMAATPLQNLERPKKTRKPANSTFELPAWIPKEAWDGYEEMRNRIKKPMTDRARTLAVNELVKLEKKGYKVEDVLNQSTLNCYQGLFPLKEDFRAGASLVQPKLKETEFRL